MYNIENDCLLFFVGNHCFDQVSSDLMVSIGKRVCRNLSRVIILQLDRYASKLLSWLYWAKSTLYYNLLLVLCV